jgi:hypothetical protein
VTHFESALAEIAADLVQRACLKERYRRPRGFSANQCPQPPLILHADNGNAMRGATLEARLEEMGVLRSFSRPKVSNDNPYSESLFRRPAQEGLHLLIETLADAADLRFGDAAGPAQRFHQGVDLPGGDATGVGLHHHGVKGLVDPAAGLEPAGEEAAALPQPGNGQGEVAHLAGEQPLPVAVAMGGALIGAALVELGAGEDRNLSFQQVLEAPTHDLGDQGASGGALHELSQLGGATMGKGHGLCSVWW